MKFALVFRQQVAAALIAISFLALPAKAMPEVFRNWSLTECQKSSCPKALKTAKRDAAKFIQSGGKNKSDTLKRLIAYVRAMEPEMKVSEMQIAQAIKEEI